MNLSSFIEAAEPLRVLGVVVSQNGNEVGRHLFEGACRRNVYSASKSFTSCAVGIAQREGLLDLGERLTDCFPEELPEEVSENLAKATVRDLLTMSLGQPVPFLMGENRPYYEDRNWVRLSLRQPFTDAPGTRFVYNNVGPYLAGILVQRRSGTDLVHYLMPRLFDPMGIQLPTWETDPYGFTFGAGGLFLTLDELHLFGQLLLNEGNWKGRQLVPSEWIRQASSPHADNGSFGYGYLFWMGPHGSYRADGKYGQYTIVIPEKNAVISVVAECRRQDSLHQAIFDYIYPEL